jgi:lipoprotein-releasing system permease protein
VRLPYPVFVGLRYLRAKRKKRSISLNTVISIVGVTVGVATLIATLAVMTGFTEDLQNKILGTNSHIIVTDRTRDLMTDYRAVGGKLDSIPHVVAHTPFIYSQVLLTTPSGVTGAVLRGVDPATERTVSEIEKNIVRGTLADLNDSPSGKPGIIVGKELAAKLGVTTGETINVLTPTGTVSALGMVPKVRRFIVVGIFETGFYEYDVSLAYISLAAAQSFLGIPDSVSGISVKVDDIFRAKQVARVIEDSLGFPYAGRDWMMLNRNLFSALKLEKVVMFIILVLIILVASFNIVSTLAMMVVEKNREIAILKAMGSTRREIMAIFMMDGIVIGLVGTLIGIPLGYVFCAAIERFYTLPSDVYFISHIPTTIRMFDIGLVSLSAVVISFLATLYPSWQAGKLDPAEALRYE